MSTTSQQVPPDFDAVAAAAASLQAEGKPVAIDTLSTVLGNASANAIARHLASWRLEHGAPPAPPAPEIPAAILADLNSWAQRYAEEAGAGTRAALAQAERDMALLAAGGEELEAERDGLRDEVEDAASARDAALAAAAERDEEIERLNAELRNARQIAMDALVGKAKDQLAIDGKDAQLADLRSQLEKNVAASAAQSDARLAAEMELVGAVTARDSIAAEMEALRSQLAASLSERTRLRAEVETLRGRAK
ncbi:DNA-binding protein [Massilia sp. GCM10023247]|uniref:DNA-binding protein n=1 Tax=Massilia sp. GCM10023247 TaxID=3252643 RepID=UPI0036092A6D